MHNDIPHNLKNIFSTFGSRSLILIKKNHVKHLANHGESKNKHNFNTDPFLTINLLAMFHIPNESDILTLQVIYDTFKKFMVKKYHECTEMNGRATCKK